MPIRLISLQKAKEWTGVIGSADDERLDFAILAASQAVIGYLGMDTSALLDSNDEQVFDSDLNPVGVEEIDQLATARLAKIWFDDDDYDKNADYGRLPREVTSMLYTRRQEMGFA